MDSTTGTEFERRVTETALDQDLLLPGLDFDPLLKSYRIDFEKWLKNEELTNAFYTVGGFWAEPEPIQEILEPEFGKVWRVHFTPPYIETTYDGDKAIKEEAAAVTPQEDQKYTTIMLGLVGLLEYLTLVEAGFLPKPDHLYGITNKTMARIAQRVGFEIAEEERDVWVALTTYEELKASCISMAKKFGHKIVNLGLNEMDRTEKMLVDAGM